MRTYVKDRLHGFGGSAIESYFFDILRTTPRA